MLIIRIRNWIVLYIAFEYTYTCLEYYYNDVFSTVLLNQYLQSVGMKGGFNSFFYF